MLCYNLEFAFQTFQDQNIGSNQVKHLHVPFYFTPYTQLNKAYCKKFLNANVSLPEPEAKLSFNSVFTKPSKENSMTYYCHLSVHQHVIRLSKLLF